MERAREELKKAIALCDPEQDARLLCACWLQIGAVYEEQGFFDEAKECYLNAREFDYENPDIQEAIRDVDAKRKAPERGGGGSSFGMPSTGGAFSSDPQTAAAMGQDPNAQDPGALAQALPALGQMLMQKFGGGGEDASGS
jgi:tetratricopeptide (TPR) repeat protein